MGLSTKRLGCLCSIVSSMGHSSRIQNDTYRADRKLPLRSLIRFFTRTKWEMLVIAVRNAEKAAW